MSDEWFDAPPVTPLTGSEAFDGMDATVAHFWAYAMSDLRMNNMRGYLAEFLVAKAVGSRELRVEWDAYDVVSPDGIRIEVKSAGYMQSWRQRRPSRIAFTVKPAHTWTPENGESIEKSLNADVYVFALQSAPDHASYDGLKIDQWAFYVLSRGTLQSSGLKSFSLAALERLAGSNIPFDQLGSAIASAANEAGQPK